MATAASSSDARTRSRRACTRYARVHFNIAQEYSSIKPVSLFLVANLSHALLCHTTVQAVPALALRVWVGVPPALSPPSASVGALGFSNVTRF